LFILDKVDKGDPEFEQYVYKTVSDRLSLVTVKKYINNTFFYADINYNKVTTELKDLDTFYNAQKSGMDVVLKMFWNIDLKDELKGKVNMDDFWLVYEESFKQYWYEDTYILPTMYQYSYYHYDWTYYYRITYSNNGNTLTKDILPENRAKEFTNILTPLRGKLHTLFTEK